MISNNDYNIYITIYITLNPNTKLIKRKKNEY